MKLKGDTKLIVAGVVVLGFGAWYLSRQAAAAGSAAWNGLAGAAGDAWQALADGAQTPWVSNTAAGAVEYAGLAVGIPRTDASACAQAKAAGDWWSASFACPAADFISSSFNSAFGSTTVRQAEQADARRVDNAINESYFAATGNDSRYLI